MVVPNLWSWSGAAYFCGTIITTIGYGDLSPSSVIKKIIIHSLWISNRLSLYNCENRTYYGRVMFMVYVIPGIALCGALLGEIGVVIHKVAHKLYSTPIFRARKGHEKSHPFFWLVYTFVSLGFFLFIPSGMVYAFMEEWSYFESIYFMMVTFTTVGFGNLTVHASHYKFVILVINFIG